MSYEKKKTDLISLGQAHIDNVLGLDTVQHSRTKGSKNGVRLYQFLNGTWTELGKLRRRKGMAASDHKGTSNDSTPLKKVENQNDQKTIQTPTKQPSWKNDDIMLETIAKDLTTENVRTDPWGYRESVTNLKVDPKTGGYTEVYVKFGKSTEYNNNDLSISREAMQFLKKFNPDKERETIAKEYYDGESGEWLNKTDPNDSFYTTRQAFLSKMQLYDITIDPKWQTYTSSWYDGGTYGGHLFVVEGDMNHKKKPMISLQG